MDEMRTVIMKWDKAAGEVISRFQIHFYRVDNIRQSMIAYDVKTLKFICNYAANDVYDRRRFMLYAPASDSYRKYFCNYTQQYVDLLNARQELPLPVLMMGMDIHISENKFEQLLAEGYFPELTGRI